MNSSQSSNGIRTAVIITVIASVLGEIVYIVLAPILAANGAIPAVASQQLADADMIMYIFTIAAIPVFMFVVVFTAYAVTRFRSNGRPTEDGPAISGSPRLQLAWIVMAIALAGFLYVVGFQGLAQIESAQAQAVSTKTSVHVRVVGQQWVWAYTYTDTKANGGPGAASPILELPIDTPIVFTITSLDVQHSFWIPELGVKEDAVPGELNTVSIIPNKLGTYQVRCVELCGIYHAYMNSLAKVVSKSDFNDWVQSQPQAPTSMGVQNQAATQLPPLALVGVGKQS